MEMEPTRMVAGVILCWVMLSALYFFWFWLYQQYRIDKVRYELFKIRDELFDYATTGKISFNDPAYTMLRQTLNGMIRFAHRTNILTLFILHFVNFKKPEIAFRKKFQEELKRLDRTNQETLSAYLWEMDECMVKHIIKSSLIVMSILAPLVAFLIVFKGLENLKKIIISKFPDISDLENEAAIRGKAL